MSGLGVAAWGFALGVVIELAAPGHIGPGRTMVLAAAAQQTAPSGPATDQTRLQGGDASSSYCDTS